MHAQSSGSASTSSRKQYYCETTGCPRSVKPFARKDNLNDHVVRKHGGLRPASGRDNLEEETAGEVRDRNVGARKRTMGQTTDSVRNVQKRRRLPAGEASTPHPAVRHDDLNASPIVAEEAALTDADDDGQEVQQPQRDLQTENAPLKEAEEWKLKYQDLEAKYQEERTKRLDAEQDARKWRDRFGKIYDHTFSK